MMDYKRRWAVDDDRCRRRWPVDDEEDDSPPPQWRDPPPHYPHKERCRRRRTVDEDRRREALRAAQVNAILDRMDASFADFNRSLERIRTTTIKLSSQTQLPSPISPSNKPISPPVLSSRPTPIATSRPHAPSTQEPINPPSRPPLQHQVFQTDPPTPTEFCVATRFDPIWHDSDPTSIIQSARQAPLQPSLVASNATSTLSRDQNRNPVLSPDQTGEKKVVDDEGLPFVATYVESSLLVAWLRQQQFNNGGSMVHKQTLLPISAQQNSQQNSIESPSRSSASLAISLGLACPKVGQNLDPLGTDDHEKILSFEGRALDILDDNGVMSVSIAMALHLIQLANSRSEETLLNLKRYLQFKEFIFEPNSEGMCNYDFWEEAEEIFSKTDVISWNSIAEAFLRTWEIKDAQKLFDEMHNKDTMSWNKLFTGVRSLLCNSRWDKESIPSADYVVISTNGGLQTCGNPKEFNRMMNKLADRFKRRRIFDPGGLLMLSQASRRS